MDDAQWKVLQNEEWPTSCVRVMPEEWVLPKRSAYLPKVTLVGASFRNKVKAF
jgi:hypothetical protein